MHTTTRAFQENVTDSDGGLVWWHAHLVTQAFLNLFISQHIKTHVT